MKSKQMFERFIYVVHIRVRPLETCFYYFVVGLSSSSCAVSRQSKKYLQLFSPAHPGKNQHFPIIPHTGTVHSSDASAPVISYSHRVCRCWLVFWSGMKPEQHGCQKRQFNPKSNNQPTIPMTTKGRSSVQPCALEMISKQSRISLSVFSLWCSHNNC